ncbi:MAG: putative IIA-like nitrogen-regulatory protein PtsN [Firmicutes bacterium]|nr:putative IIA-like nitrogen-regulatory protein PtsN [Bacillota bacterium]
MLSNFFTPDVIHLNVECSDWYEAVKVGTDLLVRKNCVEKRYLDAIVRNHKELGPYMVIAPGIMLAHARPEDGVLKLSLSLVTLKMPIVFGNETNDPVKLLITLAATNQDSHLSTLAELMELLMSEEDIEKMMNADKEEEIIKIVSRYSS